MGLKTWARRSTFKKARFRPRGFRKGYDRTGGFYGRFAKAGELKFHDVDLDDAVIAAGANVTASINLIGQGVTESTRVGRKCTIKSINWRFNILLPTSATVGRQETVRIILYLDKQANGATAANTDVLESADYQSFNNLSNKSRFRTLMDRQYELVTDSAGDGTTNDSGVDVINDTFFKKCNIPIEFDATTGAITEIRSNNIGVILLAKNGTATFESKFRLRFSDM